tara:strand:- start:37 stop:447 length:411 start_codon:yes stop_codon:yes gene_type:complete
MNERVDMLYKKCEHYNSVISEKELQNELDTHYRAETGLVRSIMRDMICEGVVKTRHELGVANECLWDLNDWPEDQGFGWSDRMASVNSIKKAMVNERLYQQAEDELVAINKLTEAPKYDDVKKLMNINIKLQGAMA